MVDVVVITQSLVDLPGNDVAATDEQLDAQEAVVNALHLLPPVGTATSTRVGVKIEWVPGSEDIARQLKTDPGVIVSVLSFRVQYITPCTVYID